MNLYRSAALRAGLRREEAISTQRSAISKSRAVPAAIAPVTSGHLGALYSERS
jgi:hypothetical protein